MAALEVEIMESQVMQFLSDCSAGNLELCCKEIDLQVPAPKVGKKNELLKLIFGHLLSEGAKEDGAFATYKILHDFLTGLDAKAKSDESKAVASVGIPPVGSDETKTFVKVEDSVGLLEGGINSTVTESTGDSPGTVGSDKKNKKSDGSVVEVHHKLQQLKISGVIGGDKEENKLSFTDLKFQIKNAQKIGYSEQTICGAVIKAIAPNHNLRTYFESVPELELEGMIEFLRPFFKQKDSASYFAELCSAVQTSKQSCMDFVVGLMGLRLRIIDLSAREGTPFPPKALYQQFTKTMLSGIKNTNIRAEIRVGQKY